MEIQINNNTNGWANRQLNSEIEGTKRKILSGNELFFKYANEYLRFHKFKLFVHCTQRPCQAWKNCSDHYYAHCNRSTAFYTRIQRVWLWYPYGTRLVAVPLDLFYRSQYVQAVDNGPYAMGRLHTPYQQRHVTHIIRRTKSGVTAVPRQFEQKRVT